MALGSCSATELRRPSQFLPKLQLTKEIALSSAVILIERGRNKHQICPYDKDADSIHIDRTSTTAVSG